MRILLLVLGLGVSLASAEQDMLPPPPVPVLKDLPPGKEGEEIQYGLDLLANTQDYFGRSGKVSHVIRGRMSCRNCHMDVGQRPYGNSWLESHTVYPQYRAREAMVLSLGERTNNCFVHPMNGSEIPLTSREMRAILLYFKWLSRGKPVQIKDPDTRLMKLPFLDRAADPVRGEAVFKAKCAKCHGAAGEGELRADGKAFTYPPLWGDESYQTGSSMSRVSVLARFVKANMPLGSTADKPQLSDEEAWDVAAFVNSQKRPKWVGKIPFRALSDKSFDYPMGPYGDSFSPEQHKFGPYQPIIEYWNADVNEGDVTQK